MRNLEILSLGKIYSDELDVSVGDSTRRIEPAIEGQVDLIWEEKKKNADAKGLHCYNGISYRLNSFKEQGGRLLIDFGLLEFKTRYALQTIPGYLELSEDYHHKGCYNGATVKTSDGQYLIVELSGKSMNPHSVDMLGGIMEKPLEIENGEDVFDCLSAELEEEGCIKKADIEDFYLRSVFLTPNTHTCFYFEVILNMSSQELLARFAKETEDQDIKSLKALSREEYILFLSKHNSPTKQLIAEIMQI